LSGDEQQAGRHGSNGLTHGIDPLDHFGTAGWGPQSIRKAYKGRRFRKQYGFTMNRGDLARGVPVRPQVRV
jgi:hypothetical protein